MTATATATPYSVDMKSEYAYHSMKNQAFPCSASVSVVNAHVIH
jgi:hypothetical protein